jgi:hypothetical protein
MVAGMPCLSAGLVVGGVAPGLAHAVGVAGRGLATVAAIQSQAVQQQGDQGQQQFQRCSQCRREVALLLDLLSDLFEGLFDLDVSDLHGPGLSDVLARLYGHDRGEHSQAFGRGHGLIASPPTRGLALDALTMGEVTMGEVAPRIGGPVHSIRGEIEPQLLSADPGLVHHLQLRATPPLQQLVPAALLRAPKGNRRG